MKKECTCFIARQDGGPNCVDAECPIHCVKRDYISDSVEFELHGRSVLSSLDLNTLEKIRAEADRLRKDSGAHIHPHSYKEYTYSTALTDLIHYLDTEIAKAKNHD